MTGSTLSYPALLAEAQPRSIRREAEAERVRKAIGRLVDQPRLAPAEDALLCVLMDLLAAWEVNEQPIEPLPPVEQIRVMMAETGIRQADLVDAGVFPNRGIASNLLSGRRGLTYTFVERLAGYFHVSPAVFFP